MWLLDRQTHIPTDEQMDRQTPDKVIPMCRYASQTTQKSDLHNHILLNLNIWNKYNKSHLNPISDDTLDCMKLEDSSSCITYIVYISQLSPKADFRRHTRLHEAWRQLIMCYVWRCIGFVKLDCFDYNEKCNHIILINSFAANFLTILFSQCLIYFNCKGHSGKSSL